MERVRKALVICIKYEDFVRWCRENGKNPHKQVWVQTTRDLMGRCLCAECANIVWLIPKNLRPGLSSYIRQNKGTVRHDEQ